jgi:predicted membrane protein
MNNIDMTVQGDILTIKIDLKKRFGPSSSGKTISIATTSGNISVPEHKDIKIGVNAYVKNSDYKGE